MEKHIIIIGSGLGGLCCGYILAKNGYRVSILEKNPQAGGCLQTFVRRGVKFETGMHYIGSMQKGQSLYKYFKYLNLLHDVPLRALDTMAYDTIIIDGKRYPTAVGRENFIEQLSLHFPSEHYNLRRYYDKVDEVIASLDLHNMRMSSQMSLQQYEYISTAASDFVEASTSNPTLRNVLLGNLPLYGGIKGKTSLLFHALIRDFYGKSAYRIAGGSDRIANSLMNSIRSMGGEIYTNCEVTSINCNATKITDITINNTERMQCDCCISDLHPVRTMELLHDCHLLRPATRQRIMGLENTTGCFTLHLKYKPNTEPYLNTNLYCLLCKDAWDLENYSMQDFPRGFLFMHECTDANSAFADAASVIVYMRYSDVERWAGTRVGRRGKDYEDFKEWAARRVIAAVESHMPHAMRNVEAYYTSTPLTYRDYTGTVHGSMYGIVRDCKQPMQSIVMHRTKIPNLLYTGQNINMHGVLGVVIGSVLTASVLVGMESLLKQILDAQQE